MFWDKVSPVYDLFENVYNRKVYNGTGAKVAEMASPSDEVLECACGTGAISRYIAPKCKKLVATDLSSGMLRQASGKCRKYGNTVFKKADITNIHCRNGRFDKVVAGNVIHLLPEPEKALHELVRVTKPGGKIIIPTYINISRKTERIAVRFEINPKFWISCEIQGLPVAGAGGEGALHRNGDNHELVPEGQRDQLVAAADRIKNGAVFLACRYRGDQDFP